jgi:hypothetical protein
MTQDRPLETVRVCNACGGINWVAHIPFGDIEPDGHVCKYCGGPVENSYFKERPIVQTSGTADTVRLCANCLLLRAEVGRLRGLISEVWTAISEGPWVDLNRAMSVAEVLEMAHPDVAEKIRQETEKGNLNDPR